MTLTEALLADCEALGAFLWTFKGRWFIALGEFQAVGEHPRYAEKVKER